MKPEIDPGSDSRVNNRIDAALRSLGNSLPAPGLEGRLLTRLAAERMRMGSATNAFPASRTGWLRRFSAPALGTASTLLVGAVIVAGSVSHSRHIAPAPVSVAPVLHLPASGVGAASAAHPAGPSSAPIPAGKSARGHAIHRQGRARIAPGAHKAKGIVVPRPAVAPQN